MIIIKILINLSRNKNKKNQVRIPILKSSITPKKTHNPIVQEVHPINKSITYSKEIINIRKVENTISIPLMIQVRIKK